MHAPPGGRDVMTLQAGEAGAGGSRRFFTSFDLVRGDFPNSSGLNVR